MILQEIDFYYSMLIVAEISDIGRFPEARKLCSWAGLVPSMRQSASTIYVGKITKKGSKWLRWILVQAAQKAILSDQRLGNYYRRVARRRGQNKAIVATAKEMLTIIYHMLSNKEEYRGKNGALTEKKYKRMSKLASN
jgi:transposase